MNALDLIDAAIADLEAKLNLAPGESLPDKQKPVLSQHRTTTTISCNKDDELIKTDDINSNNKPKKDALKAVKTETLATGFETNTSTIDLLPEICKLEFKVGQIVRVWIHPEADKLYCEEIDVGEAEPRLIASGLRKHYSLEEMLGKRVIVVSNLKVSFMFVI